MVDIDTGWDDPARAVREMAAAGAAAIHLEDQVPAKLCGHLPGKHLVPVAEMVARVQAAVSGKPDRDFVVMARTDAAANEGVPAAIDRARAYVAAGADMIFAEALPTLEDYHAFTAAVKAPVLANLTEFGQTPSTNSAPPASRWCYIRSAPPGPPPPPRWKCTRPSGRTARSNPSPARCKPAPTSTPPSATPRPKKNDTPVEGLLFLQH